MDRQRKIKDVVRRFSKQDRDPNAVEMLFESGMLDSFGLLDLVSGLEGEFGIVIPDTDLLPTNFGSVQSIDAYLQRRGS
jgi:acyl carrier protein